MDEQLGELLVTALASAPGMTLRRTALVPNVFKLIPADNPELRAYAGQRLLTDAFLTGNPAWTVDGGAIKMG
jgi:hypothetical protein